MWQVADVAAVLLLPQPRRGSGRTWGLAGVKFAGLESCVCVEFASVSSPRNVRATDKCFRIAMTIKPLTRTVGSIRCFIVGWPLKLEGICTEKYLFYGLKFLSFFLFESPYKFELKLGDL